LEHFLAIILALDAKLGVGSTKDHLAKSQNHLGAGDYSIILKNQIE
jgi:hypothetical protein